MSLLRHIRHTRDMLRWILLTPTSSIELRMTTSWAAILHRGEADIPAGLRVAQRWRTAGWNDEVVWHELAAVHARFTEPADIPDSRFAPLRASAAWVRFVAEHGAAADLAAAVHAHLSAVHDLTRAQRSR
ncbi:hypothetical protein AB0J43_00370 [Nonomuraea fuscirosea]